MNNRQLALFVCLCTMLLGFAMAKRSEAISANGLSPSTYNQSIDRLASDSKIIATPTCVVNPPTLTQEIRPNATVTPTGQQPTATERPTFTATPNDPCFVEPKVIITAPSQVEVGELFTISIQYINLASPSTSLWVNDGGLAHFEPPMNEICVAEQHPTHCTSFTLRATNPGVFDFDAAALGEAYYNGGWHTIWIHAQAPAFINIIDWNSTPTSTFTPVPTCIPATSTPTPNIPTNTPTLAGQATATSTPIQTRTPTPTAAPLTCYQTSYAELVLQAPSQVQVGDIFTLRMSYVNIAPYTIDISRASNDLAMFDPPLAMPCQRFSHPTSCEEITLRATSAGELTIDASAFGLVFINGQQAEDGYAYARNPVHINILPNNAIPTRTSTPTATKTATPCPTNLAINGGSCSGTPTVTPINGNATATPIVSQLFLSAPYVVNVGDVFTLTIQYINIGMPYTRVTNGSGGIGQFDPPLTMPCKFNQHPTQCRTIRLRAIAAGSLHLSARATGEIPIAGGGWAWGSAISNPLSIQVRDVLAYRIFIPAATK